MFKQKFLLILLVGLASCDLFTNKTQEENFIAKNKFLEIISCANTNEILSKNDKDNLSEIILTVNKISEKDWNSKYKDYQDKFDKFKYYCEKSYPIKVTDNVKIDKCSEEGKIKSLDSVEKIKIGFSNKSGKNIKVILLDFNGNREFLNKDKIESISKDKEGKIFITYLSHPYVVTDENDKCLNIYTPNESGIIEVK